jgi:hypothetical protein
MTTKRFKIEYVDHPEAEQYWFDTREEAENWVKFIKSVPLTDDQGNDIESPKVRIIEFAPLNSKVY